MTLRSSLCVGATIAAAFLGASCDCGSSIGNHKCRVKADCADLGPDYVCADGLCRLAEPWPELDGSIRPDAGADAGRDAGHDGGQDAGRDAGYDGGQDAGRDAGLDAGLDAGGPTDAGVDAGSRPDAGDAGTTLPDGGGGPCTGNGLRCGASCCSVTSVGGGWSHTCAITTAGNVLCWGANDRGQLGHGTFTASEPTPVSVVGYESGGALTVTAGAQHTCILTAADRTVRCWGGNGYGQAGYEGDGGPSAVPMTVNGLSNVAAVSAGDWHTCAMNTDGGVFCWGLNWYGEIGSGAESDAGYEARPVPVVGLSSGAKALSAGGDHNCVVASSDRARCWGYNQFGQLANPDAGFASRVPVDALNLTAVVQSLAGGYRHNCALHSSRGAVCWGWNWKGELGDPATEGGSNPVPVEVASLGGTPSGIATGGSTSCAWFAGGLARCWGNNNFGQLGNPDAGFSSVTPLDVAGTGAGGVAVVGVHMGNAHGCARLSNGGIRCWGCNTQGQLGNPAAGSQTSTPIDVLAP